MAGRARGGGSEGESAAISATGAAWGAPGAEKDGAAPA